MDTSVVGRDFSPTAANSPTLSMMATQAGLILGTAAYMSPEQAKGAAADARSDVFSLGCMLFEMLTGRQPFEGETSPEILASVLAREPDFSRLPSDLNPRLRDLLRRCLEKKPRQRWQAIGDLRIELDAIASGAGQGDAIAAATVVTPRPWWRRAMPLAITAMVAAATAGSLAWRLKPELAPRVARFLVYPPERTVFVSQGRPGANVAISPDGSTLAFHGAVCRS